MQLKGKVVMRKFGAGSKSETSNAIYLETDQGDYVLRKAGTNARENTALKKLMGKTVVASGTLNQYLFIATSIEEATEE